jgi:hypothetical protein
MKSEKECRKMRNMIKIALMLMTLMSVVSMLRFNLEVNAQKQPATGITDIAFSDSNNGVAIGYFGLILRLNY